MKRIISTMVFLVMVLAVQSIAVQAQTTEFTYQGSLKDGANPANGSYDFSFTLWDSLSGGTRLGPFLNYGGLVVTNGTFTVKLDFGSTFPGANRFIEIRVQPTGIGSLTLLTPRQQVNSAPYSLKSLSADSATNATTSNNALNLGGVAASQYVVTGDPRLSDARNPLPNSTNYIQNQNAAPQTASNFNISGTGSANIINAGSQFNVNGVRVLSIGGVGNIFAGEVAGRFNTGSGNAFFGNNAGPNNTSGSDNTFIGRSTGNNIAAGNQNTYIGAAAVGFPDLTNSTAIGANAFVGSSNSLVLGNNANVGIGTSTPRTKLHVGGGSVYIASPNSLIITSPNGACWFITVGNTGALSTFSVTCP